MKFESTLKSFELKLVLELILDTGTAFNWSFEGVYILNKYINNNENNKKKNREINNLAWLLNYEIWILLEKLKEETCLGIDFRHWEGFKMLIWRCINT